MKNLIKLLNGKSLFYIIMSSCMIIFIFVFLRGAGRVNFLLFSIIEIIFIIIVLSAIIYYLVVFKRYSHEIYEKGGSHEKWYMNRLNSIGTEWCLEFAVELQKYVKKDSIIFASPSANKGVYEKCIFKKLSDLYCVKMIISDHAEIINKEKEETLKNSLGISKFINMEKKDAKELINFVNDSDVIFDMKGAIWHEKTYDFETLIKTYHEVLCKDGLLIIDCTPETRFNILKNKIISLINKDHPRTEISTLQILEQTPKKKALIDKYFELSGEIQTNPLSFVLYKKINKVQ